MANLFIVLLSIIPVCLCSCGSHYGATPCTYVPAPPGQAPPCARPGITFCEYPYTYPEEVIKNLLEKWKYDHSTLIINESQDEYQSYYLPPTEYTTRAYPGYMYSYPHDISNSNGNKPHQQGSSYFPNRNFTEYEQRPPYYDDRKKYQYKSPYSYLPKYPGNVIHQPSIPGIFPRGREPYIGDLQNTWWKRYGHRELKKYHVLRRRRELRTGKFFSKSTNHGRYKRQDLDSSQTLCQASSRFIMPKAALNNKGNWMFVVNMPELDKDVAQLVKSEVCESTECSSLCSLPLGSTSRCEQKYVQKRLVALQGSGSNLYTDVFWFPSCCVCTISQNL